jgi:hypothetical protein
MWIRRLTRFAGRPALPRPRFAGWPLPGRSQERRRLAAALAVALLVIWTQLFIGIHELGHIGQRDATACAFAPLVSTAGGAVLPAALAWLVLQAPAPAPAWIPERSVPTARIAGHARAPPAAA